MRLPLGVIGAGKLGIDLDRLVEFMTNGICFRTTHERCGCFTFIVGEPMAESWNASDG